MKRVIGILIGGSEQEKEWATLSGIRVFNLLKRLDYNVRLIPFDWKTPLKALTSIDLAFISVMGQGGKVQNVLEMMNIPFTGSGAISSAIASNKFFSKCFFIANSVLTPKFLLVPNGEINLEELWERIQSLAEKKPIILKPLEGGLSSGVSVIDNLDEFLTYYKESKGDLLAEEYIKGVELVIGIIRSDSEVYCLSPVEVIKEEYIIDYKNCLAKGRNPYCAAKLTNDEIQLIQKEASRAFCSLQCFGIGYVDLIYDSVEHNSYVLEVGTVPGYREISKVPYSALISGIDILSLLDLSVVLALNKHHVNLSNYFKKRMLTPRAAIFTQKMLNNIYDK